MAVTPKGEELQKQHAGTSLSPRTELELRISQLERDLTACREDRVALETERAQFELFTDAVSDHAIVLLDVQGRVIRWNHGAERLMGWRAEDILGQSLAFFFTPGDVASEVPQRELEQAAQQGHVDEERWHMRRDGSRFWGSGSLSAVRNQAGDLVGFAKIMRDLTVWREAQEQLRESEERLRLFLENVTDYALLQVDTAARISRWNTGAERTFGYTEREILGAPVRLLYLPEEAARGDAEYDLEAARESGRFEDARWLVRKGGSQLFARWVTTPMRDEAGHLRGYAKVLRDETERQRTEQQIRTSLAEKHALLQEIHHRVKNNLQVITSLLSIQAARLENAEVAAVLAETENRVRAIAALHETLYSSENLAHIEFGSYTQQLVRGLVRFYGIEEKRLSVTVDTADLVVDIGQAIPLGLLLNELVTNCFKHAFPDGRSGSVTVQLAYVPNRIAVERGQSLDEGEGKLVVQDDGVGLPPDLNWMETPSMGWYLVNVLVQQLQGQIEVASLPGTSVTIQFPLEGQSEHGTSSNRGR
jgi:PAS domain S-box-containing protein